VADPGQNTSKYVSEEEILNACDITIVSLSNYGQDITNLLSTQISSASSS
jgi:hypothetical protein